MSRENCSLYVDGNTNYCCVPKVFKVGEGHAAGVTVTLANTGPVDLLVYPTGDTDEVAVVHSTLAEGSTTIFDAGVYMLDLDCEALDGTDAPEEVAEQMSACCSAIAGELANAAFLCQKIDELISGGGVSVDLSTIETLLENFFNMECP